MKRGVGRKGMTLEGAILAVIIFGVVMIILIIIYNVVFGMAKERFTKEECQASLILTRKIDARAKICLAPIDNPIPLKCTRRFVTVGDAEVSQSIGSMSYTPQCPAGVDAKSCLGHNVLAKEMAACWDTFFQGEQIVFQQVERNSLHIFEGNGDKTACFVCSEVTLHTDADIDHFSDYVKRMRYNSNGTYYDYFNNPRVICSPDYTEDVGTTSCWEGYAEGRKPYINQTSFKKGGKYAVIFIRHGLASCDNERAEDTTFDQDLTMTVQVVPADDIGKYCDTVLA